MTQVDIQGLRKAYDPAKPVLRPLDLTIPGGELFFLLGPSGCGKSTLLRILAGLLLPDAGTIRFNGTDITTLPPEKRQAAMVFQNYALWPHLDVFENVAFGLRTAGASRDTIQREVSAALELVRLGDCAKRKIPSLSGGQQQRVALARALAVRPALLLLDEPLSNLDARLRDEMRLEIRRIAKERNVTAIYVTHDRREALSMADRIAVLAEGVLQQTGTPEELYRTPANRFVATFLGDANLYSGQVLAQNGGLVAVDTPIGLLQAKSAETDWRENTRVTVMIRPESIEFTDDHDAVNRFQANLDDGVYLGDHREWLLHSGDVPIAVNESAPPPRTIGSRCQLTVDPANVVLLRDC